ncbi:CpsB/CapC family capsule biosynthesis tyrosine phosphatase [Butyricicoccus intestinisimiae]|uniref:protein-tyrosine-phosphatase n=1 Tax=Butyricicoccus intestinisimiae TaxID=2841509 RepID=A0ABS6ENZ1_9FIRM|nr:CpsB/CapC family capsule biosynthesis tyrosine phosphatase [Butyricicoccus intestinisimiae]MBU5489312.1 hypothetical protein [Butyricicoccus intestinisimiae]
MNQVLTDIHQHLIWGMDDGANSRETMFSMLREAHRQGIKTVVATSHAEPGANTILHPRNYWERRFTKYMLQEGGVDAIASDAHNCENRPVNLEAAYQWLVLHTDAAYAQELVTFSGELI